ncbi:Ras guanine nucleotide exchange factor A [Colletotrichum sp. SAR 10_70]|nr:Ras guanine nucleotide exchange factor A [Colletotrichum sp. SAR 10_71]KAI8162135.1 Ras guanine nucleotide exchange factor A [Colletotrichum sp. SAR 10_70]KAI8174909.1 Ras guanine nucleotide exchange factor A [Colletotrichum sp. SAR 10_75]KAI8193021.1 Ras guanine nucleotide exchange factor A [Colletotrichum sp. SAR 10_65]KAI8197319.1 Ras guanine nucleotide exchange factor A [Colletotrichum sp. SAR 10_76]KAI8224123.1 Ras guanine nucleotide exchange factor A [Colletotrichum sp. SAR 10_86]KAI
MASDRIGARKAHRSSEGSHIPPTHFHRSGTPSSFASASASETAAAARRAERETAHRSAPAASKQYQPHYALHRDEPFLPPRFPTEQPANYRDSIVSIVDDPFFQRFDDYAGEGAHGFEPLRTPTLHDPNPEDDNEQDDEHEEIGATQKYEITQEFDFDFDFGYFELRDDDNPNERWPPPRRESLIIGPSLSWQQPTSAAAVAAAIMESLNIAVIGASGVGKSSFVQRVLGLSRPPITNASSVRMVVDNVTYGVTLIELDLEYFELNPLQPIQWPKQINGHIVPRVDGALIIYDVMNKESMKELPQATAALTKSGLPAVLVANKCDHPESERQIDAARVANHEYFKSCVGQFNLSTSSPERARACLNAMLKAAIAYRKETIEEETQQQTVSSQLRTPGIRLDRGPTDSFLDMEESDAESFRYSEDIPILQRSEETFLEKPKPTGVAFDELVDRLIAPRMTKADNNFSDVFLCLYRKFAAPGELFSAILTRLDRVRDDKSAHYLSKTATQLRIIEVVAKWVSLYPGDFARPGTRRNLEEFIKHLSTEPIFSIAAQQIKRHLEFSVVEDDDTGWAKSDELADQEGSKVLSKDKTRSTSDLSNGMITLTVDDAIDERPSNSSDLSHVDRTSSVGTHVSFHSYDEYEREAANMEPTDVLPMNKFRYHIFMDITDDDIADEMTRIDWVMFSSIRIRDFVRHVSLSLELRSKCKSLKNVNRMINHFNHVAKWVANLILLRDKAKHRAQMLEKFMNIAQKLRRLNNYNGLAAVLAGINGTAVHRLAQTWALVPPEAQKSFAKLGILMGTQKSHFAYRLAWENSPLPRIPYIPLHRRDLVSAEEGSKTFVGPDGDRVNWKKFEVLGEVLLPLMKSQGTAYPNLTKHEAARELILDCRMPTDEEEIYQRSVQLESTAGGGGDISKKKFPWFAK